MFADVTTALTGMKTLAEFVALAAKSKTDLAVAQKAAELTTVILDLQLAVSSVQTQNYDLLRRNNELEQTIANIENWKATAEQYKFIKIGTGTFLYTNKKDNDRNEPAHWLCPHCYENRKKSILQFKDRGKYGWIHFCPNCKVEIDCPQQGPED